MTSPSWSQCLMPSWLFDPVHLSGDTNICALTRAIPERPR